MEKGMSWLPPVIGRRLPMVREWNAGRELPEVRGPTFRELWEEGIE
jgi:hypothetical protein